MSDTQGKMKKSKAPYTRRTEIQRLYHKYASGQKTLSVSSLLMFLRDEQVENPAIMETAGSLIDRYEIDETARENRSMTFEGFFRYMESKDCCIFNQKHTLVYQDMNQPLTNYFISSSHNTYLTGDQLVGWSHLYAYVCALRKGCRCLEIDCWDGPDNEPVVYHGHTLTTKILFKDVITAVERYAFEKSVYPVILSLENHCSKEQQVVMAQHLISILGDKLLRAPLDRSVTRDLPSPNFRHGHNQKPIGYPESRDITKALYLSMKNDLQNKILIKNKKLKVKTEAEQSIDDEGEDEDEKDEEEEEETKAKIWFPRKAGPKAKRKKVVVAEALSDLVIYTGSVKFLSFRHSADHQSCYENTSMGEKKGQKLVKASGADFVQHNQRFLTRIYPAGLRICSSNYNPQEFWNVGSQLVALNFQSLGFPMDLNDGRFLDNGACGYVLKPKALLSRQGRFDPSCSMSNPKTTTLKLKVISGSNLPIPMDGKALDPFVRVEIYGIPSDSCKKNTNTVKNNLLTPRWDVSMSFRISTPKFCLIRFCVRGQTGPLCSDFIGQYTLPFTSLKQGYRWVPLRSRDGGSLDPAILFVFVSYS